MGIRREGGMDGQDTGPEYTYPLASFEWGTFRVVYKDFDKTIKDNDPRVKRFRNTEEGRTLGITLSEPLYEFEDTPVEDTPADTPLS
jgi:hypothetical protein